MLSMKTLKAIVDDDVQDWNRKLSSVASPNSLDRSWTQQ